MAIYQEHWRLTGCFKVISVITLTAGYLIASENRALAQSNIVPDDTLGAESSFVVPNFNGLPVEAIAGGAARGQNLFHSFAQFNVSEGRGAYFFSPNANIQNILARVTGINPSQILGTLGTFGNSQPNLFLINPNGIIFGQNARLDIRGSFFASTANSVVFDNGYEFSATNPQAPPLLTINVPLGLQYGANPGKIVNQSVVGLQVQPGKTLALVGGEVDLEGAFLYAPDGRIELGSVGSNNRVNLTSTDTGFALNYRGVETFQDIRLTQEAFVTTNGNNGGSIQVQGKNVALTDGSQISANVLGSGIGGGLTVNASESVQVIGRSLDGGFPSGLFAQASQRATGEAGDLTITTSRLLVQDGAAINASTTGAGKGGDLIINASDSVQLIGTSVDGRIGSGLFAQASGTGDAGNLIITTEQLLIQDGARINASIFGSGKGGNLTIKASDDVQVIGRSADGRLSSSLLAEAREGTGDAGDLTITTGQLLIRDGARVSASTFSSGNGGNLTIEASDSVQVIGESSDREFFSNLSAQAAPNSTGDAGDLKINTYQLLIRDGAAVSASTFGSGKGGNLTVEASDSVQVLGTSADGRVGSNLSVATNGGTGDAGDLKITTSRLLIQDGGQITGSTSGSGKGGNLTVHAYDSVLLSGTSATNSRAGSNLSVQTNPNSTNNAGDLKITTGQLIIRDGAFVSASTFSSGKGGNLTVNASDSVQVIGRSADSKYASNLAALANPNSTGDAGDLKITTSQLLIQGGAQVSASTAGSGKGGNLTVNASDSVQVIGRSANGRFGSTLSAQANEGIGNAGDLSITTSNLLIQDGARVSASTFSFGKGGNLTVNASDSVQVIGTRSGLLVGSATESTAGNLSLKTGQLSIQDGAQVTVSSPFGQAGNMTITAEDLTLNRGTISAVTGTSGAEGGANITLQGLDLLRMDNESLISATALEDANGGNVTIDSTLIVATPPTGIEGSDITANADRGNGGSINITTQGLFGIAFRPQLTPKNDITVSSNFGLAGVYTQTTPAVDPSRGLAQLPVNIVDASQQIDRRCTNTDADKKSRFVITGRGGLPPSPTDPLIYYEDTLNWVTPKSEEQNTHPTPPENSTQNTPKPLVEAQSWVYGPNGEIILTAEAPTATPTNPWQTSPSCRDLQNQDSTSDR